MGFTDSPATMSFSFMDSVRLTFLVLACLFSWAQASAQEEAGSDALAQPESGLVVPDNYKLRPGDSVQVMVYGEPDLSFAQNIDASGRVMLPLAGSLRLEGRTTREAEEILRLAYIEGEILIAPHVSLQVTGYSPRQFYIFGEVNAPGVKAFPLDATSLDILQVLSMAGSFTDLARRNRVRITRVESDGNESSIVVDAEKLMTGSGDTTVRIFPNDRIFVPQRIW